MGKTGKIATTSSALHQSFWVSKTNVLDVLVFPSVVVVNVMISISNVYEFYVFVSDVSKVFRCFQMLAHNLKVFADVFGVLQDCQCPSFVSSVFVSLVLDTQPPGWYAVCRQCRLCKAGDLFWWCDCMAGMKYGVTLRLTAFLLVSLNV